MSAARRKLGGPFDPGIVAALVDQHDITVRESLASSFTGRTPVGQIGTALERGNSFVEHRVATSFTDELRRVGGLVYRTGGQRCDEKESGDPLRMKR